MSAITFFLRVALRIVALCAMGIAGTYIHEFLCTTSFFGDKVTRYGEVIWGARHWWWNAMTLSLFVLAIFRSMYDTANDGQKAFDW